MPSYTLQLNMFFYFAHHSKVVKISLIVTQNFTGYLMLNVLLSARINFIYLYIYNWIRFFRRVSCTVQILPQDGIICATKPLIP